jgi:hypothetical protein
MVTFPVEYALYLATAGGTNGVVLVARMSEKMSTNLFYVYDRGGASGK